MNKALKTTISVHKHHIPKTYYKPAMYALKLFRSGVSFHKSLSIAIASYTNPQSPDYINPSKLHYRKLSEHLLAYIANDY